MSLSSHLATGTSPIGRFIKETFPNTRSFARDQKAKIRACPPTRKEGYTFSDNYTMVGTALDYRIRYCFAITPFKDLVAGRGRSIMVLARDPIAFPEFELADWKLINSLSAEFESQLEGFLEKARPDLRELTPQEEQYLDRACCVLTLFERFIREDSRALESFINLQTENGWQTSDDMLNHFRPDLIEDIKTQATEFQKEFSHLIGPTAILNPHFQGSGDIGGADADLIVNKGLLDFKSTIRPTIDGKLMWQLIGYTLLDYDNEYELSSIGVYYSRQKKLFQWDLECALQELSGKPLNIADLRNQMKELLLSRKE